VLMIGVERMRFIGAPTCCCAARVGPSTRRSPGVSIANWACNCATGAHAPSEGEAAGRSAVRANETWAMDFVHDQLAILDAHYLHRDPALAESAIRKLEKGTKSPN
jgi:hypothetical protein